MTYLTKAINRPFVYVDRMGVERLKRFILELICVVFFLTILIGINYIKDLNAQLLSVNDQMVELNEQLTTYQTAVEVQKKTIATLNADLDSITKRSEEIIAQNEELVERMYLYDNYDYVLINSAGQRTDITAEQLKLGTELMEKEGIDPDMLFSIIMIESTGREKSANKYSSARGYCQLISSTGYDMYRRLGYDPSNYNHEVMALDGTLNIRMGCKLIALLMKQYNGDVEKVLNHYSGYLTTDYYNKFVNYLAKGGSSISQIEARYARSHI